MSVEELRSLVKEQLGSQGEAMMGTIAEQWIRRENKSRRSVLWLILLQHRFGTLPETLIARLDILSAAQLNQLFNFSLDAGNLGEVTAFINTLPRRV